MHLEALCDALLLQVTSLAWCPNSNLLASASSDGTTRIWDVGEGGSGASGGRRVPAAHPESKHTVHACHSTVCVGSLSDQTWTYVPTVRPERLRA
jgi:WD40 repeat protein